MLAVGSPAVAMAAGVLLTWLVMRLSVRDAREDGYDRGWDDAILTASMPPEAAQALISGPHPARPSETPVFRRPVSDLRKAAGAAPLPAGPPKDMIGNQTDGA
jgi:hypothetical protein